MEPRVRIDGKLHVAGRVCDAVGWVSYDVVQEVGNISVCLLGGCRLLGPYSAQRDKEFVVNGSGIIEERPHGPLDAEDSGGVKDRARVVRKSKLVLHPVDDGATRVRQGVLAWMAPRGLPRRGGHGCTRPLCAGTYGRGVTSRSSVGGLCQQTCFPPSPPIFCSAG